MPDLARPCRTSPRHWKPYTPTLPPVKPRLPPDSCTVIRMTDSFIRNVGEREIEFRPPSDGQLLILARMLRKMEGLAENWDDDDPEAPAKIRISITNASKLLDVIDSMVVKEADRDWLEQQILARELDLADLMSTLQPENTTVPNRAAKRVTKRAVKKAPGRAPRS